MVLEKTPESSLDCREINPFNPKGSQPWVLIGRTDAEAPIPWPPDVKSWLIGKDPDAGKDWRQEEKGVADLRWLDSITDSMDVNISKLQETVTDRGAWHVAVCWVAKSPKQLINWTTAKYFLISVCSSILVFLVLHRWTEYNVNWIYPQRLYLIFSSFNLAAEDFDNASRCEIA